MVHTKELNSPTEMELISPTEERDMSLVDDDNGKVRMKKELGLLEGVAIILGIIFGSGEFAQLFFCLCVTKKRGRGLSIAYLHVLVTHLLR